MSEVIWRLHPVYTSYEVSSDGRVRSIDRIATMHGGAYHNYTVWHRIYRGRELKTPVHSGTGYKVLRVCEEGKISNAAVHRMVCETFHGLPEDASLQVRHLNGNKLDNRADNLVWGTASENAMDAILHGQNTKWNQTHCKRGHEYTPENTRLRRDRPITHRQCIACQRENDAKRYRRNKIPRKADYVRSPER